MSHPLYGAMMKLFRAHKHLEALHAGVEGFLHEPPDPYLIEVEPQGEHFEVGSKVGDKFRLVLQPGTKNVPTMEWGTIVGDIVHNLRSALDHLAWELTILHTGPAPPDPLPAKWRRVGFPILTEGDRWADLGTGAIWGIGPIPAARIEELQPYNTGQDAPEREPLALLQELWNRDKHRTVAVVVDQLELRGFYDAGPEQRTQLTARALKRRPIGPVVEGAELAVIVISPAATPDLARQYVKMNSAYTFHISFEQGPPAYGSELVSTLQTLANNVKAALLEFSENFFPA